MGPCVLGLPRATPGVDWARSTSMVGSTLGPYRIGEQLGRGGMGYVYRAHDTALNRDVAIKVLRESLAPDPDRRACLQREAEALAALNHPNIAQVYGLEKRGDTPAIVMGLCESGDASYADRWHHTPWLAAPLRLERVDPCGAMLPPNGSGEVGHEVGELPVGVGLGLCPSEYNPVQRVNHHLVFGDFGLNRDRRRRIDGCDNRLE